MIDSGIMPIHDHSTNDGPGLPEFLPTSA